MLEKERLVNDRKEAFTRYLHFHETSRTKEEKMEWQEKCFTHYAMWEFEMRHAYPEKANPYEEVAWSLAECCRRMGVEVNLKHNWALRVRNTPEQTEALRMSAIFGNPRPKKLHSLWKKMRRLREEEKHHVRIPRKVLRPKPVPPKIP